MILLPLALAALGVLPEGDVLARVNDAPITRAALVRRMETAPRRLTPRDVLEGLVEEALLAEEGRRLGLAASGQVRERIEADLRSAAAEAFVEKEIGARSAPDEQRLRELFHQTSDFVGYDLLVFDSREKAAAALENVRRGSTLEAEARGAVVSRLHPPPASPPPVMRAQIEAPLATELFAAKPGTVVGPVELATGVALARPLHREIGSEAAFAARRASLARSAQAQQTSRLRQHLATRLFAAKNVKLDEAFLRSVAPGGATPEQLDHPVATVEGRPIPYREVAASLRALGAASGHLAGPAVRIAVARQHVEARLVEALAVERGFAQAAEVLGRRPEIERAALAAAAAAKLRSAAPAPSPEEIRDFYQRNAKAYSRPFAEVVPDATAGAAAAKQEAALGARLTALRRAATVSIDEGAVARVPGPGA